MYQSIILFSYIWCGELAMAVARLDWLASYLLSIDSKEEDKEVLAFLLFPLRMLCKFLASWQAGFSAWLQLWTSDHSFPVLPDRYDYTCYSFFIMYHSFVLFAHKASDLLIPLVLDTLSPFFCGDENADYLQKCRARWRSCRSR